MGRYEPSSPDSYRAPLLQCLILVYFVHVLRGPWYFLTGCSTGNEAWLDIWASLWPVWPDVTITCSPIFPQLPTVLFFKPAHKVTVDLGRFCTKICTLGLSKTAQSDHTDCGGRVCRCARLTAKEWKRVWVNWAERVRVSSCRRPRHSSWSPAVVQETSRSFIASILSRSWSGISGFGVTSSTRSSSSPSTANVQNG